MSSRPKLPLGHRQHRMLKASVGGLQQEAPNIAQLQEQILSSSNTYQLANQPDKVVSTMASDPLPQQEATAHPHIAHQLHAATLQQAGRSPTPQADVAASLAFDVCKHGGLQLQHKVKQHPAQWLDQQHQQQYLEQQQVFKDDKTAAADQHQAYAAAQQWTHQLQQPGQLLRPVGLRPQNHNHKHVQQQQQQQMELDSVWPVGSLISADYSHQHQQQQVGVLETLVESPVAADALGNHTTAAAAAGHYLLGSPSVPQGTAVVSVSPEPSSYHELLAAFPDMVGESVGEPLCSSHASIGLMSAVQPAAAAAAAAAANAPSACNAQQPLMSSEGSTLLLPNGANFWQQQQQQQQQSRHPVGSSSSDWDPNARRFSDSAIWPIVQSTAVASASCDVTRPAAAAAAVPPRPASSLGHRILRPHSSSPIPNDSGSTPISMTQLGSGDLLVDITPPTKITTQLSWSLDPDAEYLLDASTSGSLGPIVPLPGSSSMAAAAASTEKAIQPGKVAHHRTDSILGSTAAAAASSTGGSWGANLDGLGSGVLPRSSSSSSGSTAAAAAASALSPRASSSNGSSSSRQGSIKPYLARNRPRRSSSSAAAAAAAAAGRRVAGKQQQQHILEARQQQQQQQQQVSVTSTSDIANGWLGQPNPNAIPGKLHHDRSVAVAAAAAPTAAAGFSNINGTASMLLNPRLQYDVEVTSSPWHPSDAADYTGDYLDLYRRAYCSHGDVLFPPLWLSLMWLITTSRLLPLLPLLLLMVTTWFAGCYIFVIKGVGVSSSQLGLTRLPAALVLSLEILCTGCFLSHILPRMWLGHSVTCAAASTAAAAMLLLHWAAHVQDPGYVPVPQHYDTEAGLSVGDAAYRCSKINSSSTSNSSTPPVKAAAAGATTKQPLPLTLSSTPLNQRQQHQHQQQQWLDSSVPKLGGRSLNSCWTCGVEKNLRSKHCPVCKRCVERFDHHCPVIGNCVGARNHTTFVTYLITLVICQSLFVHLLGGMLLQQHITHISAEHVPGQHHSLLAQLLMPRAMGRMTAAATTYPSTAAAAAAHSSGSSSGTGSTLHSDSTGVSGSTDDLVNIVLHSTITRGIDGRIMAAAAAEQQAAAAAAVVPAVTQPAAAAVAATGSSSSSSKAAELEVLLQSRGGWGLSGWLMTVEALRSAADSSPGLLLLLLLQVPALFISCSLLLRSLLLAAANLTVNEWMNRHRYLHMQHKQAGFCNRFDRGPLHNCWEVWSVRSDDVVNWWSVWQQADDEINSTPDHVLVPMSATSIIRFCDNRWARYQHKIGQGRRGRK